MPVSDGNFFNPLNKNPLVKAVAWLTDKQGPYLDNALVKAVAWPTNKQGPS
jgi:hypothetical protein